MLNPSLCLERSCTFFWGGEQIWLRTPGNGGLKSSVQASARSATHCGHRWPKGFSRAEKRLGFGSFRLNVHMVFMFEAELMSGEATWAAQSITEEGAGTPGSSPGCVTLRQSPPLSGPSIFIFEMQSPACLKVGSPALGWGLGCFLRPEEDKRERTFRWQDQRVRSWKR